MKASLKKSLTAVGIAAALSGVSTNSMATVMGDAGEAWLIPFAYWDSQEGASSWDTVINVTIPSTVGGKTIPNVYTANNTTPRGLVVNPPVVAIPPDQTPFAVFQQPALIASNWAIQFYFQSFVSNDVCDGPLPITPEDFNSYRLSELCPGFENYPGYLTFTTAAGAAGNNADFAFFADAYLTADNSDDVPNESPATFVAWQIPALPMPDGADTAGAASPITAKNQVIEASFPRVETRPITAGIGTFATSAGVRKVIDLMLGDREEEAGPLDEFDLNTLLVFWNDENLTNRVVPPAAVSWDGVGVHLFDEFENGCSTSIPLPWELNLVWFRDPGEPAGPLFIEDWLDDVGFFTGPSRYFQPARCQDNDDAFLRVQLPREGTGATFNDRTAMYAFSLMMWWDGAYAYPASHDEDGGEPVPMPSVGAHDRGLFGSTGNIWVSNPFP